MQCTNCYRHKTAKNQLFPKLNLFAKADIIFITEHIDKTCEDLGILMYGPQKRIFESLLNSSKLSEVNYTILPVLFCRCVDLKDITIPPNPPEVLRCEENYLRYFHILKPKVCIMLGKDVEKFYDKFVPNVLFKTITSLSAIEKSGGLKSPYIDNTLRTLIEVKQYVDEHK